MSSRRQSAQAQTAEPKEAAPAAKAAEAFRIFISYTHADERFREDLDKHLSPLLLLGRAETWHDRHIPAGARLYEKIQGNIESAHIILMLISPDYLFSKSCQGEMATAMKRSEEGTAVAIPVVIRACNWTILPIGKLLAANEDARPINSQADFDVAWTQVAKKIGEIITEWDIQHSAVEAAGEVVPVSAAAEEEQSLEPPSKGVQGERWVNRREDNDADWEMTKYELVDALVNAAAADNAANVTLNVRRWGEKILVDYTLPQYRNPRRILIRDIGGDLGYPGYQFEAYPADGNANIEYSRVRWLNASDGTRILRQIKPAHADTTVQDYAQELWRKIVAMAKG